MKGIISLLLSFVVVLSSPDSEFEIEFNPLKEHKVNLGDIAQNNGIAFSPNGKGIMVGGSNHKICWIDGASNNYTYKQMDNHVYAVDYSIDGRYTGATSTNSVRVWDLVERRNPYTYETTTNFINALDFSPIDNSVLIGTDDGKLILWNFKENKSIIITTVSNEIQSAQFSVSGTKIIFSYGRNHIRLIDLQGNLIQNFVGHEKRVWSVKLSPNENYVLSGSSDGYAFIWDANNGEVIHKLNQHKQSVNSVAFSACGDKCVTGSSDGTAFLWNVITGNPLVQYIGHKNDVVAVAFSPNNDKIITGSQDKTVKIWAVKSYKPAIVLESPAKLNTTIHHPNPNFEIKLRLSNECSLDTVICTQKIKNARLENVSFRLQSDKGYYRKTIRLKKGENIITIKVKNAQGVSKKVLNINYIPKTYSQTIWAVVAGINYNEKDCHEHNREQLRYAKDDAWAFSMYLTGVDGGKTPNTHITTLIDNNATKNNILTALNTTFKNAKSNDIAIFYFAGHGIKRGLVPYNQDEKLRYRQIVEAFNQCKAINKVLIVDACYAGSMIFDVEKFNDFGKVAMLLSCKEKEASFEKSEFQHGVFTHYLLEALKKSPNINEVFEYAQNQTKIYTNNVQIPTIKYKNNFDKTIELQSE